MLSLMIFLLSTLGLLFFNFFFKKYNFLLDNKSLFHKDFVSKDSVPLSGGLLVILNLILLNNNNYLISFFFLLIFFLGLLSDLLIIRKPLKKFFFQFLLVFFFLFFLDIKILSTKVFFIDFFIGNKIFSIFFTCFCLLILINGTNFIDGINTLVCGYYILIILIILFLGSQNKFIIYNYDNFFYLLLSLISIFIFNFFSKTFLGDSGSFLLSFVMGYYLINFSNFNLTLSNSISPIFIVLLLWYPAFENLFSIIRKLLFKRSPFEPDNKHLHQLLFLYLKNKRKYFLFNNTLTGILINFFNLIVFLIASKFYFNVHYLVFIIFFNIFFYLISYFYLYIKLVK
jgi:UDP-N-acetylmuramyl pentapeptide phosphotransferase/UDP-N-acetylglucosamine-1-phosphate transferase